MMNTLNNLFQLKKKVQTYFAYFDMEFVRAYLLEGQEEDVSAQIKDANDLLEQIFVFHDIWDMEPCSQEFQLMPMRWDQSPNDDPEWIFMLNRQEYLNKLVIAQRLTKDNRYGEKLKWYLFDWMKKNPIDNKKTDTNRTIDTGIRCMVWLNLLIHLVSMELISDNEIFEIIVCIKKQIQYLKENYLPKYDLSNWGVLQTTAICSIYLWLGDMLDGDEQWAWDKWELQMDLQIYDEGVQWEQSSMYHVEVLNAAMKLIVWSRYFHKDIKEECLVKVKRMAEYVLYSSSPHFKQICQGDSDVSDIRDVLTKAAILFNDPILKFGGFEAVDLDTAFFLGKEGIINYEKIPKKQPDCLIRNYKESGNIYIRSSFLQNASFTYLRNGPLGSSHGHVDLTHMSVFYNGQPFLTDCGRYSYREDALERPLLKSAKAHNVSVIDQTAHGIPIGSWEYKSYGKSMRNFVSTKENINFAELPYTAKLPSGQFYLMKRSIVIISPNIWFWTDEVYCDGRHTYEQYLNLDDQIKVRKMDQGYVLTHGFSKLILLGSGKFKQENGIISKKYNESSSTIRLVKNTVEFQDRIIDWCCLIPEGVTVIQGKIHQLEHADEADHELVTVKEFVISEMESYTIIIFHLETFRGKKLYYYREIPIYGRCVVLKKTEGIWRRIRF